MQYDIERLKTATAEELQEFYLYRQIVEIMTITNGEAPEGSCCGKNKKQHADAFIAQRDKYIQKIIAMQKENTIKALVHGAQYVGAIKKHVNIDTLTDEQIVEYVNAGYFPASWFDFSAYKEETKETETTTKEQTKTTTKTAKKRK